MADYRQSCGTPRCGWTGFNGHDDFCPYSMNYKRYLQRKEAEQQRENEADRLGFNVTGGYYECRQCFSLVRNMLGHRETCRLVTGHVGVVTEFSKPEGRSV